MRASPHVECDVTVQVHTHKHGWPQGTAGKGALGSVQSRNRITKTMKYTCELSGARQHGQCSPQPTKSVRCKHPVWQTISHISSCAGATHPRTCVGRPQVRDPAQEALTRTHTVRAHQLSATQPDQHLGAIAAVVKRRRSKRAAGSERVTLSIGSKENTGSLRQCVGAIGNTGSTGHRLHLAAVHPGPSDTSLQGLKCEPSTLHSRQHSLSTAA